MKAERPSLVNPIGHAAGTRPHGAALADAAGLKSGSFTMSYQSTVCNRNSPKSWLRYSSLNVLLYFALDHLTCTSTRYVLPISSFHAGFPRSWSMKA
jgi:hypothetical protein